MTQHNIIRTKQGVLDLIEYLKDKEYIAHDTETTGVKVDSEIIGVSVCAEPNVGHYIIVAGWNPEKGQLDYYETKDLMPEFHRSLVGKSLIQHNGVFDCAMVWNNYKVRLIDSLHTDTMILAHVLDENRRVGLKELAAARYGSSAKKEQEEMKASVERNGGTLTKDKYEMYKADPELMAKYGSQDAILTYNLFYEMVPELYEDGLDAFFYDDESMPLLRGPTYDMNTTGIKIDLTVLQTLKKSLEIEILSLSEFIYREIEDHVKDCPIASAKKEFNVGSGGQLAWLLFEKLGNMYPKLSDAGRELCQALGMRTPYDNSAKREFVAEVRERLGQPWREAGKVWDRKTRRYKGAAKVRDYWNYISTDKAVLATFAKKYKWVEKLLEYKRLCKLLSTYVEGIEAALQYGIIQPSFLQHGTTSGRYSCRNPNFQNLPREDKRVKACLVARPGKVFVGADHAQLEPRVFASTSGDTRLLEGFEKGEDFYSVVGAPIFGKTSFSLFKDDPESFAKKHPALRDKSKVIALATPYGRTASQQASAMGISRDESQALIDSYFAAYPNVKKMMLESHETAKRDGVVYSLFGRPRRIPEAKKIASTYGNLPHSELPYVARQLLNLAMNHRVQSTGASIMNRGAIRVYNTLRELEQVDPAWKEVHMVLQVHDELVLEGPEELAEDMVAVLKDGMENAVTLPGISLIADPKIAKDIASLK